MEVWLNSKDKSQLRAEWQLRAFGSADDCPWARTDDRSTRLDRGIKRSRGKLTADDLVCASEDIARSWFNAQRHPLRLL